MSPATVPTADTLSPEPTAAPALPALALDTACPPQALWAQVADQAHQALAAAGLALRDAVLLLPYAALLPPARQAFAQRARAAGGAGWLPRIETVQTLAASLGPEAGASGAAGPSGDAAQDRLAAASLLMSQGWTRDWAGSDRRGFDQAVSQLVDAAWTLRDGAQAQAPEARAAWWDEARRALPLPAGLGAQAGPGPGATEAALARIALEWAALAPAPATDRLFGLRPSAWLALGLAGLDPVTQALLTQALQRGEPAWVLQADGLDATGQALADPFGSRLPAAAPQLLQAADGEDEALAAASAVLQALNEGAEPVALVAEDRLQVRRVRALLERAGVPVLDETGWTLATTRAAAQLMALLRAVHPQAGSDDRLNWLKAALPPADELALVALEAHWRGAHGADAAGGHSLPPPGPARTLWQREQARLRSLASLGPAPADLWLQQLHGVLAASDAGAYWSTDAAALQVRRALGLAAPMSNDPPAAGEGALLLDLDAFTAWVDATLERAVFTPPPAAGPARVVVTPLARAIARPFACAVLPGSDEQHLGPPAPAPSLLPEAVLRRLGLPDRAARAWQQAAAFVQLQRLPRLVLLQRQAAGDEALGPSPLLQRLLLARRAQGLALPAAQPVALAQLAVAATPVAPPQPVAPQDLPSALSASTLEALRDCPYRFFSRAVLRLREDEELDQEAAKRDYGNWLHAVLQVFHDRRAPEDAAGPLEEEAARLVALADDMVQRPGDYALSLRGLDAAELLAFRVDLDGFARRYLQWLRTHEALGWRYERGESAHEVAPAVLGGMRLKGRIDRIDRLHASRPLALAGAGAAEASQHDEAAAPPLPLGAAQVLDYKTGSLESLRGKVRQPLEDTQLAFYAALLLHGEKPPPALRAGYLALDSGEAVQLVAHRVDVADSAEQMLQGLAHELDELRAGAALPALGQGRVCELCEARGLCRRDHWADT